MLEEWGSLFICCLKTRYVDRNMKLMCIPSSLCIMILEIESRALHETGHPNPPGCCMIDQYMRKLLCPQKVFGFGIRLNSCLLVVVSHIRMHEALH